MDVGFFLSLLSFFIITMNSFISNLICIDHITKGITICISFDYTVYSFGNCNDGLYGHKEYLINIPTQINNLSNIKMIDCGISHTICLDNDGNVFSFGSNSDGKLGITKYYNELKQTHVPQKLNLPPCKQVSCGYDFSICLTEDNNLYSFGDNCKGQLGLGSNNRYENSPQLIPDFSNIEYIACGVIHAVCKTNTNDFYSWGSNSYGQLGQGNNEPCNKPIQCLNWPDDIISIKCGFNHSFLLTSKGHVYSFGSNRFGELGINDKNIESANTPTLIKDISEIQRIECGENYATCIDINNNLWVFGFNIYGQLGLGDKNNRYKPILHPTLSNIIDISSGGSHTFSKTKDNKIYAFGKNNYNQLGIKTSKTLQLTPIQVFIDKEDIWYSAIGKKSRQKSARK